MKRFYPLYVAGALTTMIACSKSGSNNPGPDPDPGSEVTPRIIVDVAGPKVKAGIPAPQGNAESNFLGYGYDITGKYADSASVRAMAIDMPALIKIKPDYVDLDRGAQSGSAQVIWAKSAADLARRISLQVDEKGTLVGFKGSVTDFFSEDVALSGKYVYGDYSDIVQWRAVKMYVLPEELAKYLTPAFKSDLQVLPAAELVKKYGTHYLTNIVLGAKVHAVYQAVTSHYDQLKSAEVGAEIAFMSVLGNYFNLDPKIKSSEFRSISAAKIVYEVIGGDGSTVEEIKASSPVKLDVSKWRPTLGKEPMFVKIRENGVRPIEELITDPVKKAAVKAYIDQYISDHQLKDSK